MAQYLFVEDSPEQIIIEATSMSKACEEMPLLDGDVMLVYRITGPPQRIKGRIEHIQFFDVEEVDVTEFDAEMGSED